MNIDVKEIDSSKELLTIDEWQYGGKITYQQKITESQTFYIYRFFDDKVVLFITDGLKTDPPLSPTIYEYDKEQYEKVFTIPKGIIHTHHSDWIDPDHLDRYDVSCRYSIFISTERNDDLAKEKYKQYLQHKVDMAELDCVNANHELRIARKTKKKYQAIIDSL